MDHLFIIVSEPLSQWSKKGEIIDRYFNPGNLFREVTILAIGKDSPNFGDLERMVGTARLNYFNFRTGNLFYLLTFFWNPLALSFWAKRAELLAVYYKPDMVRCYSANLNMAFAIRLKRKLNIPILLSMHINPMADLKPSKNLKSWLVHLSMRRLHRKYLPEFDLILPVYSPIVQYLTDMNVTKTQIAYNMISNFSAQVPHNPKKSQTVNLITVGRHIPEKSPERIIRAVASLPGFSLTIVGDGPEHQKLKVLATELGINDRVDFSPSLPNEELLLQISQSDLLVLYSKYSEFSKVIIESLLIGIPVLVNQDLAERVSEVRESGVFTYGSSSNDLVESIANLSMNRDLNAKAKVSKEWAIQRFSPEKSEEKFVQIYRHFGGPSGQK